MLQFSKGLINISIHRERARPFVIIPFEVDSDVLGGVGITFNGIMLAHGSH